MEAPQHDHHNTLRAKSQSKSEIHAPNLSFARVRAQNVVEHPTLIFGEIRIIIKVQRGDTNDPVNPDPHEKPDRRRAFT